MVYVHLIPCHIMLVTDVPCIFSIGSNKLSSCYIYYRKIDLKLRYIILIEWCLNCSMSGVAKKTKMPTCITFCVFMVKDKQLFSAHQSLHYAMLLLFYAPSTLVFVSFMVRCSSELALRLSHHALRFFSTSLIADIAFLFTFKISVSILLRMQFFGIYFFGVLVSTG